MKSSILLLAVIGLFAIEVIYGASSIEEKNGETSLQFGFKTDNGYERVEEVKYNKTPDPKNDGKPDITSEKPVEYRGGYSFISDDGYEYTVKYKANKNGFQPYVTAHKLKSVK